MDELERTADRPDTWSPIGISRRGTEAASNFGGVPEPLRARPQWVTWRRELTADGKPTKVPYSARTSLRASSTDPSTWSGFAEALDASSRYDGIGYVFASSDPFVGIDLDHCRDAETGQIQSWAKEIIDGCMSYTEVSPSGAGVHIFVRGVLPAGARKRGSVEMYSSGRYFTVTGDHLPGTPVTIQEPCVPMAELHALHLGTPRAVRSTDRVAVQPVLVEDAGLLARARRAANGDKFSRLYDLGDTSEYGGDDSAADLALCSFLAFWTGRDPVRMDRLFRQSALMRAKWDEKHFAGGRTYGEGTIDKAISSTANMYTLSAEALPGIPASGERPSKNRHVVLPSDTPPVAVEEAWPGAAAIPAQLPSVEPFASRRLLPPAFAAWVEDIAERAQCPPDFVGVAAMVGASALVGRHITICPKQHDDWTVTPNLWGLVIGRPGIMKSPALEEALKPIRRLVAVERSEFQAKRIEHEFLVAKDKAQKDVLKKRLDKCVEADQPTDDLRAALVESAGYRPPTERRYLVNDTTVEKLGELLNENPNGLLLYRDELLGWLRTMDRQGHENDRAFYCEAWNGNGSYTYDRISRGTLHINACCLSVPGGIQPGPLQAYLREIFSGGQDDGLIQRFQLLVYPDAPRTWRNVDRRPDRRQLEAVADIYTRLSELTPETLGLTGQASLRFSPAAQEAFDAWRATLEATLRTDDEHPVIISHLSKYRSLMPSLALICHAIEGNGGAVTLEAAERAIAWCEYLETHARRVYHPVTARLRTTAALLAARIRTGRLRAPFTVRDVLQGEWAGLTDRDDVVAALDFLGDLGWIRPEMTTTSRIGGRPTVRYLINPKLPGDYPSKPSEPPAVWVSRVLKGSDQGVSSEIRGTTADRRRPRKRASYDRRRVARHAPGARDRGPRGGRPPQVPPQGQGRGPRRSDARAQG